MRASLMIKFRVPFGLRVLPLTLALALLVSAAAPAAAQKKPAPAPSRVVAIGDVHGDYDAFVVILQRAGLLDAKLRWAGGKTAFVLTGDFLDRGPKDPAVMDLLMRLEKEAQKKGGRAVVLLGNHEAMNLMGDLRYVSKEVYASFADKDSEARREQAWENYAQLLKKVAESRGQAAAEPAPEQRAAWMLVHPPGFLEHRAAMAPDGKYGRWLRERSAVAKIGGTVFLHGGISPALGSAPIEEINKRVAQEISAFDSLRAYLTERGLALPFYTLEETVGAMRGELEFRNTEQGQRAAAATAEGKTYSPTEEERQHVERLSRMMSYPTWYTIHPDGPLWFRGYGTWTDEEGAPKVESLLANLGAERFVVGHTPQKGSITVRFGGRVFLIDTGMLSSYYTGGRGSALEIASGNFTAIYANQRVALDVSAKAPGAPAGSPEPEEAEIPGGGVQQQATGVSGSAGAPVMPVPTVWLDPAGKSLPFKTNAEVQDFLLTAKAGKIRGTPRGIAGTRRVILEKDGMQMNSAFRTINEEKPMIRLADGRVEFNFRDSYKFEQAAYELALLLGLDNVPPTVERTLFGERGTLQAWIEGGMVEGDRQKKRIPPPDSVAWNRQVQIMRVFDNLIYNTDRNMGNIVIDKNWKIWMIDHTRAFRRMEELNAANGVVQCERHLFEKLKALDEGLVRGRLEKYLRKAEIEGLLKRRHLVIEHIERMIRERGEAEVLFTLEP